MNSRIISFKHMINLGQFFSKIPQISRIILLGCMDKNECENYTHKIMHKFIIEGINMAIRLELSVSLGSICSDTRVMSFLCYIFIKKGHSFLLEILI